MKFRYLLLAPLLFMVTLQAELLRGTTVGKYQKPGAPIDMTYTSSPIDINETADINITLSTTKRSGTLNVIIRLDDNMTQHSDVPAELNFEIKPDTKAYVINLKVSSSRQGLSYIRLLTKLKKGVGSKLRAFAVPVQIGKLNKLKRQALMMKPGGEKVSISKAVETITEIKE